MALRAIKFSSESPGSAPTRGELDDDLIRSFSLTRLQSSPAAYVVLNTDLTELVKFRDVVIDRGRKHEAKPLAKLLLGHRKIPFINGSYESAGQLVRSVRTLLENAFAKDDHNIYIIGTSDKILEELWNRAGSEAPNTKGASEKSPVADVKAKSDGSLQSQVLLQLLPHKEIPHELLQTYVGSSTEVQLVRQLIIRAAASDDPVLVLGDTGTGKEVIARSIHNYSSRAKETFMPVNCGAIPIELLESELFGHRKHVFTDAKFDKKGLWEITGGGTLFLDEVGDLAPVHQVKILRVLEENKVRPIGAPREIEVNARIVAATNRDLFSMVKAGKFREDLYYRLRAFLLRSPALRDHPEDIPTLARFFWKKIAGERSTLPNDILDELRSYMWPGNARELKAVLMSLHTLFGADNLDAARLRAVFQMQGQAQTDSPESAAQNELLTHRVDCLRHLRRVDEVLRACTVSTTPLVKSAQTDIAASVQVRASLRTRLTELEQLCLNPLLFHGKVTFEVVDGLNEKLSYFYGLLEGDAKIALSYWRNEVTRELKLALTAIFQETERLEANV
jgi:DNA-binding NtrC family response regulator